MKVHGLDGSKHASCRENLLEYTMGKLRNLMFISIILGAISLFHINIIQFYVLLKIVYGVIENNANFYVAFDFHSSE